MCQHGCGSHLEPPHPESAAVDSFVDRISTPCGSAGVQRFPRLLAAWVRADSLLSSFAEEKGHLVLSLRPAFQGAMACWAGHDMV